MSYNQFNVEPKELISDSLQDVFESPEDSKVEDLFILASLVISQDELFTGNLLAIEMGDNPKLDIKTLIQKCFKFIGSTMLTKKQVHSLVLSCGEDIIQVHGPFKISSLKIVEMDYEHQTCVLAIDLSKCQP